MQELVVMCHTCPLKTQEFVSFLENWLTSLAEIWFTYSTLVSIYYIFVLKSNEDQQGQATVFQPQLRIRMFELQPESWASFLAKS